VKIFTVSAHVKTVCLDKGKVDLMNMKNGKGKKVKDCYPGKYHELIAYGIAGVLNTVLNFGAYQILESRVRINYLIANAVAWILSFVFSFIANKVFVFQSGSWERNRLWRELWTFFCCSIGTGILDMAILYAMVDLMGIPKTPAKAFDAIGVIIINYVVRKLWVFRKDE